MITLYIVWDTDLNRLIPSDEARVHLIFVPMNSPLRTTKLLDLLCQPEKLESLKLTFQPYDRAAEEGMFTGDVRLLWKAIQGKRELENLHVRNLQDEILDPPHLSALNEALRDSPQLKTLSLNYVGDNLSALTEVLAKPNCCFEVLKLTGFPIEDPKQVAPFFKSVAKSTTLTTLHFNPNYEFSIDSIGCMEHLTDLLKQNPCLERLEVKLCDGTSMLPIFQSLKHNTLLKMLSFDVPFLTGAINKKTSDEIIELLENDVHTLEALHFQDHAWDYRDSFAEDTINFYLDLNKYSGKKRFLQLSDTLELIDMVAVHSNDPSVLFYFLKKKAGVLFTSWT